MNEDETIGQYIAQPGLAKVFVGYRNGLVLVDFGQPLTAFELPPDQAAIFARALLKHAENAREEMRIIR